MIAAKELADHVLSVRFTVLLLLLGVIAAGITYAVAGEAIANAPGATEDEFLFLRLLTLQPGELIFSFVTLMGFLAPLLGIAFGFDAVSAERASGTLPRLVSQPIHRDDVVNGKFVAGLTVIATVLVALALVIVGIAMARLGVAPSAEEVARLLLWLVVLIVYVGFWLAFATLCSIVFRGAATSALVCIATWLVLTLFWGLIAGVLVGAVAPIDDRSTLEETVASLRLGQTFERVSPNTLYAEVTSTLLSPEVATLDPLGAATRAQDPFAFPDSLLSLDQSLLVTWPQTVALIALTIGCFALAYAAFMRQEVRA